MDQGHNNLGEWNTAQYGGWGEPHFSSSTAFGQPQLQNGGYRDPNTFATNSITLDEQQPGNEVPQHAQYGGGFSFYPTQSATGWMEAAHPSSVPQPSGVNHRTYAEYQSPHEMTQTVNPANDHFSFLGLPHDNQFGNHIQAAEPQEVPQNFNNGTSSIPNHADQFGFRQQPTQQNQWQNSLQRMPNGYGSPTLYGRPVVASPPVDSRNQTPSPSPYPPQNSQAAGALQFQATVPTSPAVPTAVPAAVTSVQQARFISAHDAQPLHRQAPVKRPTSSSTAGIPNSTAQQPITQQSITKQPIVQQPMAQQPMAQQFVAQQPMAKQIAAQQSTAQQPPTQQPTTQQITAQQATAQQLTPQPIAQQPIAKPAEVIPEKMAVPAPRPQQPEEAQEPMPIIKNTSPPVATATQGLERDGPDPYLLIDKQLAEKALDQGDSFWQGVGNLVASDELQTCTVPERITRQPMFLRGDKPPLFSAAKRPSTWTQAEILGIHLNNYLSIPRDPKYDMERVRADAILETTMRRADKAIPKNWWTDHVFSEGKKRKLSEWKVGSAPSKRLDLPADAISALSIKTSAILALPGLDLQSLQKDHPYAKQVAEEYAELVTDKVEELKESETFKELTKTFSERRKKGPSADIDEQIRKLQDGLALLVEQFNCVVDRGLQEAHPAVLANVEETKGIKVSLFNSLVRLLNIKLGSSPLVSSLLKLLARFQTVKPSQLETYKFTSSEGKVCAESQLAALKSAEISELVTTIIANAKKNEGTEPVKGEKGALDAKRNEGGATKKGANGSAKAGAASSGAKRQREDDGEARHSKKIATESRTSTSSPVLMGSARASSAGAKAAAKSTAAPKSAAASANLVPAKPRSGLLLPGKQRPIVKPVPKSESPKPDASRPLKSEAAPKTQAQAQAQQPKSQSLQSSSSSSSDAAKATKLKAPSVPSPPNETVSQSSRSSLAALLAEIDKPKTVSKKGSPTPVAEPDPNETEQEKARRLRKEERRRRGLRVRFQSDDRLVEVREFQREEGEGHSSNVTRDVKSESKDKREGMALKKGHIGEIRPWDEPAPTDFGVIPGEKREQLFVTRGGEKDFQTEQQKVMADREKTELIAVYTDPAEIPPSPKSPPAETSQVDGGNVSERDDIHLPNEQQECEELRLRQRDQALWGFRRAMIEAQTRLEERLKPEYGMFIKGLANRFLISLGADPAQAEYLNQQILQLLVSRRAREYSEPVPSDDDRPRTKRRRDYTDASAEQAVEYVENVVERVRQDKRRRIEEERKQEEMRIAQGLAVPTSAELSYAAQQSAQAIPGAAPAAQTQDFSAAWAEYFARQGQQGYAPQVPQQGYSQPLSAYAQPQQPELQQQSADPNAQVTALLASLSNASGHAAQQPSQADSSTAQIQALMAALSGSSNANAPAQPQPAYQPSQAASTDPQYLLSLVQWATGQNQAQPQPANTANQPYGGPSYGSNGNANGNGTSNNYGQARQQQQDSNGYNNNGGNNGGGGESSGRRTGGLKGNRQDGSSKDGDGANIPEHLRGINRSLIGTKPCSFYAQGRCAKGDKCTFRHD